MLEILRTPEERFKNLIEFPFESKYVQSNDIRLHYIEEGKGDPILCLHGEPSWCYLYRKMIPTLSQKGRTIAFDFPGFGKSDKYTDPKKYTYEMFYNALAAFVESLQLKNITLVVQDWGGLLGIPFAVENPALIKRLVIMNTGLPSGLTLENAKFNLKNGLGFLWWRLESQLYFDMPIADVIENATRRKMSKQVKSAYDAPFPSKEYKVGAHVWPTLVPTFSGASSTAKRLKSAKALLKKWNKPTKLIFSNGDPVTRHQELMFQKLIPAEQLGELEIINNAGHFLQEDTGEEIAERINNFIRKTPF